MSVPHAITHVILSATPGISSIFLFIMEMQKLRQEYLVQVVLLGSGSGLKEFTRHSGLLMTPGER